MDPRTQLPLHIAMLVSMAEADGAKFRVCRIGGQVLVIVEAAPDDVRERLFSSGFGKAGDRLMWFDRTKPLVLGSESECLLMANLHVVAGSGKVNG